MHKSIGRDRAKRHRFVNAYTQPYTQTRIRRNQTGCSLPFAHLLRFANFYVVFFALSRSFAPVSPSFSSILRKNTPHFRCSFGRNVSFLYRRNVSFCVRNVSYLPSRSIDSAPVRGGVRGDFFAVRVRKSDYAFGQNSVWAVCHKYGAMLVKPKN